MQKDLLIIESRSILHKINLYVIFYIGLALCPLSWGETSPKATPSETNELIWLVEDSEENKVLEVGVISSTSTSTYTESIILSQLSTLYTINLQRVSMKRIDLSLNHHENACVASRVKNTTRLQYSLYSTPQNIYLGHKLYRLASSKPLDENIFNDKREIISLKTLFSIYPKKILAIPDAISYGDQLDEQIENLEPENIYLRGGIQRVVAIREMLYKKRVDFMMYYPTEMQLLTGKDFPLESYSIANITPYILGFFSCAKGTFGEHVISQINEMLDKAYKTEEFYNSHTRWLLKQDIPLLNRHYIEIFGSNEFINQQ